MLNQQGAHSLEEEVRMGVESARPQGRKTCLRPAGPTVDWQEEAARRKGGGNGLQGGETSSPRHLEKSVAPWPQDCCSELGEGRTLRPGRQDKEV